MNQIHWLGLALGIGLVSCASGPKAVEFAPGTDPSAKLTELRQRSSQDRERQYDQLSPGNFEEAQRYLTEAQRKLESNEPSSDVLESAGKASTFLDKAEAMATRHAEGMASVTNARQTAIRGQANTTLPGEFAAADAEFRSLGAQFESGKADPDVKTISHLESRYNDLELKSLKRTNLGQAQSFIESAEERGAKKKAPRTLNEAKVKYDAANRAIEASRRDPAGFKAAVDDSVRSARKLDFVMNTIARTHGTELAAVQIYNQDQQLAGVRESEEALKSKAEEQSQTLSRLQGENAVFNQKAELDRKIDEIRAEFKPEEAEVLHDGNRITLRLKAMKFPSSRAELTPSSMDTLAKVKEMIEAVPVAKVTVEGHTDSVGSDKKNLALSQQRAEAVKRYLVADKAVPEEKVEAQGFGFYKPLTSNKTKEGRETNRRVDVVIETETG